MSQVYWKSLDLAGFGIHEAVTLEFPEGLSVFVAPNERGKSTAVAGLTAVVFGLPTSSDQTAWGQARFRNNRGLSRFEGSTVFVALDGKTYQVQRNFETHRVRLSKLEGGSWVPIFEGDHNPGAYKSARIYEEQLKMLVGLTSHELFNSTFNICQPLASGHMLSEEVAGLLAGAGGGSHTGALKALEDEIIQRTKYTRQYDLPGNNKTKDRELEHLENAITETQEAIRAGRDTADTLQIVQQKLAELEEAERLLKTNATQLEHKLYATEDWLSAWDEHQREQQIYIDLRKNLGKAEKLHENISDSEHTLLSDEPTVYDWDFVEGKAAPYLRDRHHDAKSALSSYQSLKLQLEQRNAYRAQKEQYPLFNLVSPEIREDLHNYQHINDGLHKAFEDAKHYFDKASRVSEAHNPDRGYEDVARLSSNQLQSLERALEPGPPLHLILAVVGLAIGGLVWFLSPFEMSTPQAIGIGVAACIVGWLIGSWRMNKASISRREAKQSLERHADWQKQKRAGHFESDILEYQKRLEDAQEQLSAFLKRTEPYRNAYGDVAEAYRQYTEAVTKLTECENSAERLALDIWQVTADEVAILAPDNVPGHWQRLATFSKMLDLNTETVEQLCKTLQTLFDEDTWKTLEDDAAEWDKQQKQYRQQFDELEKSRSRLTGILDAEKVTTIEALLEKEATQSIRAVKALQSLQKVCDDHPELPRYDDPAVDRSAIAQTRETLGGQYHQNNQELERVREEILVHKRKSAEAQGRNPINIAAKEIELKELREQKERLQEEIGAFALAYQTLSEAVSEYQDAYLDRLSEASTHYFAEFTGDDTRRVSFTSEFHARITEQHGAVLEPVQLSQGAQDQLALAVRLAIADMIANNLSLPLVFDDPFQNCDSSRLERIESTLSNIAKERQVLVLSHEMNYLSWGEAVQIENHP